MSRKPRTRKQPVCFFSLPKCASSSVAKLLVQWENTWNLMGSYDQFSKTNLPPEEVDRLWRDGWWFTFVRNPWARLISAWHMFEQNPKFCLPQVGGRHRDLAEVVALADIDWSTYQRAYADQQFPRNLYGTDDYLRAHLCPCTIAPLSRFHFVGQVEAIKQDWNTVQDCTGIRVALGKHNETQHQPYRHYFTPDLKDAVARIYRDDIERFDYSY
jgi:hypothetical protein